MDNKSFNNKHLAVFSAARLYRRPCGIHYLRPHVEYCREHSGSPLEPDYSWPRWRWSHGILWALLHRPPDVQSPSRAGNFCHWPWCLPGLDSLVGAPFCALSHIGPPPATQDPAQRLSARRHRRRLSRTVGHARGHPSISNAGRDGRCRRASTSWHPRSVQPGVRPPVRPCRRDLTLPSRGLAKAWPTHFKLSLRSPRPSPCRCLRGIRSFAFVVG